MIDGKLIKKTKKQKLIEKASKLQGEFSYDKVASDFGNGDEEIIITCKAHGDFKTPAIRHHLNKFGGCEKCKELFFRTDLINGSKKNIHRDEELDYSKVRYVNSRGRVTVVCKTHGDCEVLVNELKKGAGCQECARARVGKLTLLTTEGFINKSKKEHGDLYDYSLTKIGSKGRKSRVVIICKKHGEFEMSAENHYRGKNPKGAGCQKCSRSRRSYKGARLTVEAAEKRVKKANEDYIFKEIDLKTKLVTMECRLHGNYVVKYNSSKNACECGECKRKEIDRRKKNSVKKAQLKHSWARFLGGFHAKTFTALRSSIKAGNFINHFIEVSNRKHKNKYCYKKVTAKNNKEQALITCEKHGDFSVNTNQHMTKGAYGGCPLCKLEDNFIRKAKAFHRDFYSYELVNYADIFDENRSLIKEAKVPITCPDHGVFYKIPSDHLKKEKSPRCPKCSLVRSKGELKIKNFFDDLGVDYEEQIPVDGCVYKNSLLFDFAVDGKLIEFQGEQHYYEVPIFTDFDLTLIRDQVKRRFCRENNIPLLEIKYDDMFWQERLVKFLGISL